VQKNSVDRQTNCKHPMISHLHGSNTQLMSVNNIVCGVGRCCGRCMHGERRYVKDKTVIAHADRLVVAEVRQRDSVGRTVTTEYLPHAYSYTYMKC